MVLVHGGGHTGMCYLETVDGRPGWAQQFAMLGHTVYVPDWPGVGRSGWMSPEELNGACVCAGLSGLLNEIEGPVILLTHSMSGAYGWKLAETQAAQIKGVIAVAPAPPGNIQPVPEILLRTEHYVEVMRGAFRRRIYLDRPMYPEREFVVNKLISASTRFPRALIDVYRASLLATPHRLAYERANIERSQLKVADPGELAGIPYLLVTGEHDPDHTHELDGQIVDWLRSHGAEVDFWFLPDRGIAGNGHMMMLEENSDSLAQAISEWIMGSI